MNEASLCLLNHAVTRGVLCGCNPPPRGISYTRRWSERWVRTCTSAPGNASPQRSRKVPSEGFIQRCSALGGNRLHWWLIYRINTKGIGFLSHFFSFLAPYPPYSHSLSFSLSSPVPVSSVWEAPVRAVKQSLNIFSNIFSPVRSCFSVCYISRALLSTWQRQLKWKDRAVFKCLNTVCAYGSGNNQWSKERWSLLATLAPSVDRSTTLV